MLLNSKKSQEINEVQNTTERAPGRWPMKGDEKRPLGCKNPTPPCALAKILPETTVHAYFSQIENDSPTTNTIWGIVGCLLGFWPLGQNPAGATTKVSSTLQRRNLKRSFWICVRRNLGHMAGRRILLGTTALGCVSFSAS